ncbi:mobilization protein [Bosea eneae]|uniref:Mobilization protein n=1 Tax=Bosea eneae TaxID=151454 RepID=A0ABW0J211_9HYPH
MAKRSIEERLAQLDAQRKTLQARLGRQERANDTRRKVLLGALVLQRLETSKDAEFVDRVRAWLKRELPGFLTRDGDRTLFPDLIELSAGEKAAVAASQVMADSAAAGERA